MLPTLELPQSCSWSAPQEHMATHRCTSPIPCGGLAAFPSASQLGTASESEAISEDVASMGRKKRRRRRKPRRKEGTGAANSSSEELEPGTDSEPSLLEKPRPEPPGCVGTRKGLRVWGCQPGFNCCFLC